MKKLFTIFVMVMVITFGISQPLWAAFFSNGDFATGDLTGYFVQEDFCDVPSSNLANVVDDGSGTNYVAELFTGYTSHNIYSVTLGVDIGIIPALAEDLFFDIKITEVDSDVGGSGAFLDLLSVYLLTDLGDFDPIIVADITGNSIINPSITTASFLSNGFTRVTTDISSLQGATEAILYFDFFDEDDFRLTKANIDNLDMSMNVTPIPEPATLFLLGIGLLSITGFRKKINK